MKRIQESVDKGLYAAGYISYEAAPAFDSAFKTSQQNKMPYLCFGLFDSPEEPPVRTQTMYSVSEWTPNISLDEYNQNIHKIKEFIQRGETYQVNYTIRMNSRFTGDDFAFYQQLKKAQSSDYCCYLRVGKYSILSASPELFFSVNKNKITTRPMKGTVKRGKSYEEDLENFKWLGSSDKNKSENLMIVDLIRNDLGLIAETGSVKVPSLFNIETYPTVHQMTSTITADLSNYTNLTDVFKALFPCGSITGAPKISTMEIISKLENSPREVYCGAIGYITPGGEATFNVPIRTVIIDNESGCAEYGVGGGITWDSTHEDEYNEILAKAKLLQQNTPDFQLLESIRLEDGEYFLFDEHIARIVKSAKYFAFNLNLTKMMSDLHDFASAHSKGCFKIRLLVSKQGEIFLENEEISPICSPKNIVLADSPISKGDIFLYHKTTNREIYNEFKSKSPDFFDVLLWNKEQELTEFTNGNLVMEINGELYTPYVKSGLLAGTYRQHLINSNKIKEKNLTIDDLKKCSKIWFINSVRKWVEVTC